MHSQQRVYFSSKLCTTTATKPITIYHYNTRIKALCIHPGSAKRAILLYSQTRRQNLSLSPDTFTFPLLLKAITSLLNISLGTQIHSQTISLGFHHNLHISNALIRMYSLCDPFVVSNARKVFDEMTTRNVVSWSSLITSYVRADDGFQALLVFRRMIAEGTVDPDDVAMLPVLSACVQIGGLELGKRVHCYIEKKGLHKTLPLENALVDMYAKSGDMGKAVEVFENMRNRSVVTWTTMIGGFAAHGMGKEALEMFSRMEKMDVRPNEVTFVSLLSACRHVGLVEEGRWFFNVIESRFMIRRRIEHYGCMVDLLGRYGYLKEAEILLSQMPFEANAAIWGSLLAASRIHDDVELAEKSLRHLITLEPDNSGYYMILSNIYAYRGQWNESRIMRTAMKNAGVRKALGSSSIEVDRKIHEFCSGEKSHPQFEMVDRVLSLISQQLSLSSEEQLMLSTPYH